MEEPRARAGAGGGARMTGRPSRRKPAEPSLKERAREAGLGPGASAMCVALIGKYPIDPREVSQPEGDFFRAYGTAKRLADSFATQVLAFGVRVGAPASTRPGHVKGLERLVEKFSLSGVVPLDLLGGKVKVDTLYKMYDAAIQVHETFKVVAYRDRILKPQQSGYRDLQFVVDIGNHYAELKIMHALIDEVDGFEHRLYEIRRSLEAISLERIGALSEAEKSVRYGDPREILTPIEKLVLATLEATSAQLFNQVWQMVQANEEGVMQGGGA